MTGFQLPLRPVKTILLRSGALVHSATAAQLWSSCTKFPFLMNSLIRDKDFKMGQSCLDSETSLFFLQISMVARKGKNDQSFVTIDEFVFLQSPLCDFQPEAAKPTDAPPTAPPTTTPEPTEPPDREIHTFPSISYYFHIPKIFLNFFPHTGKNRNRRKSNLLP